MVTETMVPVDGIELCVESFGEPADPALLLIAGRSSSMDWWEDEFCRRLAAAGRYVVRYDHRDTGRSTSFPAGSPPYSVPDLANDALGVLDGLHLSRAHLVGIAMGGALAQRIAIERPHRVLSLTLIATSAAAGPCPAAGELDGWSHRRTAVTRLIGEVQEMGGLFTAGEAHLRRLAERVFDRTIDMAASRTNHRVCPDGPATGPRLAEITAPTLVLHGTQDPMFPAADAQALADAIPDARLVWLEGVGHEIPPAAVWTQVIDEIVAQGGRRRQAA